MSESEQHQNIKYGDIIYIEFSSQKDRNRNILRANGFNIEEKECFVEVDQLTLNNDNIYYKDFINNLFIIFPKMKDDFIKNQTILKEKLNSVKEKMKSTLIFEDNTEFKENITKLITAFQETKQDIYNEKDNFLKEIGQPIFFKKDFILIHFDSQNFVKYNEEDSSLSKTNKNNRYGKLILTENYSDDCIFLFSSWSSLDNNAKFVFSNQNVYICKKEKNLWSNSKFLCAKEILIKANESVNNNNTNVISNNNIGNSNANINNNDSSKYDDKVFEVRKRQKSTYIPRQAFQEKKEESRLENINEVQETKTVKTYILDFADNQNDGIPFKIKICSNYIDPSSGLLSFSSPVWLVCQNIDRHLTIYPNNIKDNLLQKKKELNNDIDIDGANEKFELSNRKRAISMKKLKLSGKMARNKDKSRFRADNNIKITFDSVDKNNSLNNIYGLFFVEQCENRTNLKGYTDDYLKNKLQMKIDLKMSSYVQYHKVIRFLHAATRKYLAFIENSYDNLWVAGNLNANTNDKTFGSLKLFDKPDDNCNWMFMESYKILDEEKYFESKSYGVKFKNLEKNTYNRNTDEEEERNQKRSKKRIDKKEGETEENIYKIKNKEILRIFHVKSQKFLCFDVINDTILGFGCQKKNLRNEIYKEDINMKEKSTVVQNLSLSKTPYDSDLIRLIPSNSDQSWEIRLVLYYSEIFKNKIDSIINLDYEQLFKAPTAAVKRVSKEYMNTSFEINYSINNRISSPSKDRIEDRLKVLKENIKILKKCFKNLTDYCLNNYSRKFDITMSPGKPIFYRQQFLRDRKFLDRTFSFLEKTKKIKEFLNNSPQKLGITDNQKPDKMSRQRNSTKGIGKNKQPSKNNIDNSNKDIIESIINNLNESIHLSFKFISAMCKDHVDNKKEVFDNKEIFIDYLLDYEIASKCFLDIIKDNENFMNLLSKESNEVKYSDESYSNVIEKVINHLNSCKEYDIKNLSTLSKFLITGDVGITSNQQYIFEEIFINGKDHFLIKIKPLYDDIQLTVVFKNEKNNYISKSLIDFCETQSTYNIKYLAVQLNLYADLCYGRNYVCIEKIRELFPLDHLIYHISKTELNQEILAGLINILNFVYIDIEPHSVTVYPSLIKVVNNDLRIERVNKDKVRSYIPLDKLNLILCLSLFILNNIKYGKIKVNSANINMIFNIIKLRLYENVIYTPMDIDEVKNEDLNRKLHNLKDDVRTNVILGEEILINKSNYTNKNVQEKEEKEKEKEEDMDELEGDGDLIDSGISESKTDKDKNKKFNKNKNLNSFYNKFGYKYIEFNFENPTGEEYLLFVLDRINDFFLNSLIINNIDYNTENKNIISQSFKSTNNNDILTQSNINYLMENLKDIKYIFSKDRNNQNDYKPILKQIEKVINYILDIKKEDMSIYLLENLFKANKSLFDNLFSVENQFEFKIGMDLFNDLKKKFFDSENINQILLDNEYYYYQLFNHINCSYNIPKIFSLDNNNQNILLGGNTNEKITSNLLDNSLFSEDKYQEKIIDFSEMDYFNQEKKQLKKDGVDYKDDDYFYNKINLPREEINLNNVFINSVIFKNLEELIARILEMNIDDKLTKILLRMFTRLMSQRKELFESIKNVLLLYKKEDLDKYYQCNVAIFELGLLAEKTEKWMTVERVLDNVKGYHDLEEVNINEIKPEQKDFFAVYLTLYKFTHMLIDKNTGHYLSLKEIKLIQTIFHSFQIENILSSLLREITQEFPEDEQDKEKNNKQENNNNVNLSKLYSIRNDVIKEEVSKMKIKDKDNEKDLRIRDKLLNFKKALEKLIKEIFKLFEALVHKSSPNQSIIEVIEFTQTYSYFKDLGFNKLITELSYDQKYVKLKTTFLIDRLKEQLNMENIKKINDNFFDFHKISKEYKKIREYKIILKKTILSLKLMKNLISRITDAEYLSILISKFVETLDYFTIFAKNSTNNKEISSLPNFEDNKKNSLYLYTLEFAYYFLSIAFRLAKKSQRLKEYIYSLLNLNNIRKVIIEIPLPYTAKKINELKKAKLEKSTKLVPKLKYYYKLKGVGIEMYYYLGYHVLFQMNNIGKNIKELYEILNNDLTFIDSFELGKEGPKLKKAKTRDSLLFTTVVEDDFDQTFNDTEETIIKDGYELLVASYRKTIYNYFFVSIFPIIYRLKSVFKTTQESANYKREFFLTEQKWSSFLVNNLLKEKDQDIFKKIFKVIKKNLVEIKKFFVSLKISTEKDIIRSEANLNIYVKKYLDIKEKQKGEEIIDTTKENEILFQMIMIFTSDLINDIENNEIVTESIKNESKILAKHLKSKINFHAILKRSAKENEVNVEDLVESSQSQEREIHLVNIFLKFIQENYAKKKYSEEINSLIGLMADLNEVTPEILLNDLKGIEYTFFFKDKIAELNDIFSNHVQKFFLNNGSIEIFIKMACEGNNILNEQTFPIIIHFFNNVLEGGNTDVQKKFAQLFQSLPNSDNFFFHISQFFNKDVFEYLKNSTSIIEPKIDMENLNTMKDILRFLQLLAENHNITLQNFLREQSTNRLSYNFVNILVEYLSMLLGKLSNIFENSQEFTEYFINLYFQRFLSLLDTICEFLQGPCQKNQEYLINTKIIESFDKILGEIILSPEFSTGKNDTKSGNITSKKETETTELATFGVDYYKSGGLDAFIAGEETHTRKIDTNKKGKNPQQNKLFTKLTDYQKSLLIFKISLVFLSIIEGRKTKDNVIKKLLRDFDYKLIFIKCGEIYLKLKNKIYFFLYIDSNCKDIDENELSTKIVAEAGFNLYFLIQNLLSFENEDSEFKKYASFMKPDIKLSKEQIESYDNYEYLKEAMNFYSNNSLNIEILKDDIVFKVYCPKLSFFNGFDEKIRKNFEDNAKRSSTPTKLMSLMNEKDKIYQKIKQLSSLEEYFKNIAIFKYLYSYPNEVQSIGFYLIVIMNLLIFIGFNTETSGSDDDSKKINHVVIPGLNETTSPIVLKVLGCIIAVFSLIKLFEFITREAILIFKTLYTNELKEMYESKINTMSDLEIHSIDYFLDSNSYRKILIYLYLLIDIKVLYAFAYMVFALLGIFIHNFFFAFHLIEFIISQPILQYVFRAIVDPIAQLAYTFIFFFILIYFYSLIIFYNFQDIMPENSCDSPVICMAYIYSNTFTSGGNLGNFIDEGGNENSQGDMIRYALDISYTIIMVWLVWQMVSGLIVDTFESLRGIREDKERDMKTSCFICGMDKEKIEKYYPGKEGFEKHLQDHSIINYFFYTFYLEDKDSSEYSGLESYIKNQIDKESIMWFPNGRSLKIEEWESKHKGTHDS